MTERRRPEVADVFRSSAAAYLQAHRASAQKRRVLRDLIACQTAALGGHKEKCDACGFEKIHYNSCRNRHCPKCQGQAREKWLSDRTSELLETPYHHVVFTLPEEVGPLALQNPRIVYSILFRASADALLEIARDPKHLGAEIGFLSVLHTWGQKLDHHPHVHCVVPGGGFSPDRTQWISAGESFFLPVRVLSRLFRGKFIAGLRKAFKKLEFHGRLEKLRRRWDHFLRNLYRFDWVVYSKPPFGGSQHVLKYIARYTHGIAIKNRRLTAFEDGRVTFSYKDYRSGGVERSLSLEAIEFIRRFLQHVLPSRFHRIRYYGFLGNKVRKKNIALARELLPRSRIEILPSSPPSPPSERDNVPKDPVCPKCKKGHMIIVATYVAHGAPWETFSEVATTPDTS
jgi:Putative transposase/Transposase zinc-binding domain